MPPHRPLVALPAQGYRREMIALQATDLTASRCAASAVVNALEFLLRTQDSPGEGGGLGDLSVSNGCKAVQFGTQPIMDSTQVGQGIFSKSTDKPSCFPIRIRRFMDGFLTLPLSRLSEAFGVGKNPDSLPDVGSAGVGSRYNSPPTVVPQRGQVSENSSEPPRSECWAVFHERKSGSYLANDPRHFGPEAGSLAVQSVPVPGDADVLARKSARNHVNKPSPRSSVKRPNVIPNRERREKSVILSGGKNARSVWLPLNSADRAPSEEVASENASTSAREQSQLIHLNSSFGLIPLARQIVSFHRTGGQSSPCSPGWSPIWKPIVMASVA
jgi:hypothetical protein